MPLQICIPAQVAALGESAQGGAVENRKILTGDKVRNIALALLLRQVAAGLPADDAPFAGGAVAVDELDGAAALALPVADEIGNPADGVGGGGHVAFDIDFLEIASQSAHLPVR